MTENQCPVKRLGSSLSVAVPSANRRAVSLWSLMIVAFFSSSLIVLSLQHTNWETSLTAGLFIPDVVNLARSFDNHWISGTEVAQTDGYLGVWYLYGWTWLLHPSLCYLINVVLMVGAIWRYTGSIITRGSAPAWSLIGVVGNPYLLLAMPGPNKEIPLLFLTTYVVDVIVNRPRMSFVKALIASALMLMFRQPFGLLMVLFVVMCHGCVRDVRRSLICTLTGLSIISALNGYLASIVPYFQLNVDRFTDLATSSNPVGAVATSLGFDPLTINGGFVLFFVRSVYNVTSLAWFPVLFSQSGDWQWLGFSYWIFGLSVICALPSSLEIVAGRRDVGMTNAVMSCLVLSTLALISCNLYVQPRYLMPVLPFCVGVLSLAPSTTRRYLVSSGLVASFFVIGWYAATRDVDARSPNMAFDLPAYVIVD